LQHRCCCCTSLQVTITAWLQPACCSKTVLQYGAAVQHMCTWPRAQDSCSVSGLQGA
jgi:hypothetical protein